MAERDATSREWRPKDWPEGFTGPSCDSRTVEPGNLFFAIPGTRTDGAAYAVEAANRGAAAVIAERPLELSVPVVVVPDVRRALAEAAAEWFASQPETICAVTGTAGKTSIVSFLRQIWTTTGKHAAQIGTTGIIAPGVTHAGSLTTPDAVALQKQLKALADSGVTHAAMEASSHGLQQRRLDGVRLSAAAFTNLGRDHLDYHPDMGDYHRAKMRLFTELLPSEAPAVINADDEWSAPSLAIVRSAGRRALTVGRQGTFIAVKRVEHERTRQQIELVHEGETFRIALPFAGDFQVSNALIAAGLAIATGIAASDAFAALETLVGAPGRLELVGRSELGASVYVDYAHKPDALRNVLEAVRPFTTGRLKLVFGCGGDRDRGKRAIMGGIAEELADDVIVTDDNPRSEEPAAIRAEIMSGARSATEIADRGEAIRAAIASLARGDTLVIAGKGHETGQTANGVTVPFSDHDAARAALRQTSAAA